MKLFTSPLIFILTIISSLRYANAQNCNINSKQDPFSNLRIVESDEVKVYSMGTLLDQYDRGILLSFQLREDTIYICFQTAGRFMVPAAFKSVLLKLSDNSILSFNSFIEAGPTDGSDDYTFDKSYCIIDKPTLIKLSSYPITILRFQAMPARPNRTANALTQAAADQQQNQFSNVDTNLGTSKAKKVMKNASCMLLNLK